MDKRILPTKPQNSELKIEELIRKQEELSNEIEALTYSLNQVENEIFYRKHPECRPKQPTQ